MGPNRIIGIVLLAIGAAILIVGMNASNSFSDQVTHGFTGHYTDRTTWYIFGGAAAALFGVLLTMFGGSGKTT